MLTRFDKESEYHFTTFSSFNKEHILLYQGIPEILLRHLETIRSKFNLPVYGFAIMPNHVHLMWHIPAKVGISKVMQLLKGRTSLEILKVFRALSDFDLGRITMPNGQVALWKRRFYDFNLLSQEAFMEKLEYIHNNPVKWGLVKSPADWPYSSFRSWFDLPEARFEIDRI